MELIAVGSLLIVVFVTLIVNRLATIALTATGLSTEVAQFHSRSALAGVEADSWVVQHLLADLHLPVEGVLVLGICRADGTFLGAPRGDTRITEHDTLILHGYADVLEDLGHRKVGMAGDQTHTQIVSKIAARQAEESATDPASGSVTVDDETPT